MQFTVPRAIKASRIKHRLCLQHRTRATCYSSSTIDDLYLVTSDTFNDWPECREMGATQYNDINIFCQYRLLRHGSIEFALLDQRDQFRTTNGTHLYTLGKFIDELVQVESLRSLIRSR